MKKVCCIVALAAISFGSVFAHPAASPMKTKMVQDTIKKEKKKPQKMKMKKKKTKTDTMTTPTPPMNPQ